MAADSYTVSPGDTLSKISATVGVSVADLAAWNEIADINVIMLGQELKLYDPNAKDEIYVIQPGDTVSELALRFGKRWIDIAVANKLENIDLIIAGEKLIIPARGVDR